jgi:hypothetical protein
MEPGGSHARQSSPERVDQRSNFGRCRSGNHSGDCSSCMGEHNACSQQSRTKWNTGINGTRPDPAASHWSRDHHGNGALTASYRTGQSSVIARSGKSVSGQPRRLGGQPPTSGLPRSTDIANASRHVSNVPEAELNAGRSVSLACLSMSSYSAL